LNKDYRKFIRHKRASDMKPFLKSGCDMGWYGHFVGPVPIYPIKIKETVRLIMVKACRTICQNDLIDSEWAIHTGLKIIPSTPLIQAHQEIRIN